MNIFDYKSPDFGKLARFGFKERGGVYTYSAAIMDGQFELTVDVAENGGIKTLLTDTGTCEPYIMHLIESAGGSFVGAVRAEYEQILQSIADNCFNRDVFGSDSAHAVIEYARRRYGDEPEYLWKTFPSNAVLRRKDNNKWYGIIMLIPKRKLGLDGDEVISVLDLRIDPGALPALIDGKRYFPGYHMNKKSWVTVPLDGSVPTAEICGRLDDSYNLAGKK